MPNTAAAPNEADAPRPWARAILHARIPVALKLLLLALFGAFAMARTPGRSLRALRQDWLFSTDTGLAEDLDSAQDPYVLRRLQQLRAEIGWLMRGHPNRGMSPANPPPPPRRALWPRKALSPWGPASVEGPITPPSARNRPRAGMRTHAPIRSV